MPFNRPSLQDLNSRIQQDINGRLTGAESRLRHSVLGVLARVSAAMFHGVYGYLDYLARQLLPDTADGDWLRRHAAIWGVPPKAAEAASGPVILIGENDAPVPAGTELQRIDGAVFATSAEVIITAGTATAQVTAVVPGAAGVTAGGTALSFVSPVSGVQSQATVGVAGISGGADEETDAALRARLLLRIRNPSYGGSASDYERWTREIAGVTRVWVYPKWYGEGTVGVGLVYDGRPDIIPLDGDLDTVAEHLEALRPVTARVLVFAPIPDVINFTIALNPNTTDARAAVEAELADLLYREAAPGGTIPLSHIRQAISNAVGEYDHTLISPVAPIVSAQAHLPIMGTITWA